MYVVVVCVSVNHNLKLSVLSHILLCFTFLAFIYNLRFYIVYYAKVAVCQLF